jgi:hypothetical protein
MKISLVFPPFWETKYPPIGIAALKSYLELKGHQVLTYDFNGQALPMLYEFKSDIIANMSQIHYHFSEAMKLDYIYFMSDELLSYVLLQCGILSEDTYYDAVYNHFRAAYTFPSDEELYSTVKAIIPFFHHFFEEIKRYCIEKVDEVLGKAPNYVGCSCYKLNLPFGLLFLKILKEKAPLVKTLMGGFHPSLIADNLVEQCSFVDHIVVGEGEELLAKLCDNPNIKDRIINEHTFNTGLLNLNDLPIPDFSDFEVSKYEAIPIEGSRGCLFKCKFCREPQFWKKHRTKGGARLRAEMEYQALVFNKTNFFFTDSLVNSIAPDLSKELIKYNCNFTWAGQFRIIKDPLLLKQLAASGLTEAYYGRCCYKDDITVLPTIDKIGL